MMLDQPNVKCVKPRHQQGQTFTIWCGNEMRLFVEEEAKRRGLSRSKMLNLVLVAWRTSALKARG